jgi:hypothetical protein
MNNYLELDLKSGSIAVEYSNVKTTKKVLQKDYSTPANKKYVQLNYPTYG